MCLGFGEDSTRKVVIGRWYLPSSDFDGDVMEFSARVCLARGVRCHASRPFHPFARVVEERIISEVSFYGLRSRARLGAWPLLLSQNDKDGCRGLPESARRKQPKAPNSVLIELLGVSTPRECAGHVIH